MRGMPKDVLSGQLISLAIGCVIDTLDMIKSRLIIITRCPFIMFKEKPRKLTITYDLNYKF